MWGPSHGSLIAIVLLCAGVGAVLAVGCEHGCAYVRQHLHVEWLHD